MKKLNLLERFAPTSRRAFVLGLAVALAVLAGTILAGVLYARSVVREQIASRDAEALHSTTMMEQFDAEARVDGQLPDDQVGFEAALLASRLKGVIGIRFFDNAGRFKDSFPATIQPKDLEVTAQRRVSELRPASHFRPQAPLSDVFIYLPQFATGHVAHAPILEVSVPLHRRDCTNRAGAAQFILEGQSIATEYARLDKNLTLLGTVAFLGASSLLLGMLWPVYRRIEALNEQLKVRNERLQHANQELALAARTSAVGAVSAHLMHGLKNPLASLSQFVRNQTQPSDSSPTLEENGNDALSAARRMQRLVEETLEVLADARGEPGYDLSVGELVDSVRQRLETRAAERKVNLTTQVNSECQLPSRTANLLRLILVNLSENAIDATPAGKSVSLTAERKENGLNFLVKDEGPGFPEHLRKSLFLPCPSTRKGGSGVGLAISHQIATHLGAELQLHESSATGCVFNLALPLATLAESTSSCRCTAKDLC